MIRFLLNDESIETDLPPGLTVLDFVRYRKNLKGTKIGCREGDCGACTVITGELVGEEVQYRTMTSCLMPLANAAGKHIVTVEGINPEGGGLTPVQSAIVENGGTQCGFCTVGFVMSLTSFCIDGSASTKDAAVSAIDGNICRCTGYKSLQRAGADVCRQKPSSEGERIKDAIKMGIVPEYFAGVPDKLKSFRSSETRSSSANAFVVAGGTDLYVQRPEEMVGEEASHVFYSEELRGIQESEGVVEIGASATVTDLLESELINEIFPRLYDHLKLVSSTPIRNMATLGGNFVNASPIGDMTVWFLALDAEIVFNTGRSIPLKELYLDYKELAKKPGEMIVKIRFKVSDGDFHFNFEKVCKREFLDIATVNTAISFSLKDSVIENAHVAAGGVAPVPLYLRGASAFLNGSEVRPETVVGALDIIDGEISPISDVRGSAEYKRVLLRQLFKAHFVEMFGA